MKARAILALLAAATAQACAQQDSGPAASPFSKPHWTVAAVSCPIGCSEGTRDFLQTQLGHEVDLTSTRLAAPWDDPCEGTLRWDVHAAPTADIVADVNRGVAPTHRQLTAADLKLDPAGRTTTAVALCHGAGGDMTQQRLLSVEPARILVLFEEQSVIELR